MIRAVLVANRGEIARRIFRTCRELGIGCVAVFSDPDSSAPHVAEANAAVRLPGNSPADTYLRADLLVEAALKAGADAVHPGYGFLAENADFAQLVIEAGLTWIGPPPEVIAAMGSKVESKRLMASAGVPVLEQLDSVAESDLPVLVKASAGGGGRGLRVVRDLASLDGELAAARSEAESAFGDPTVFCERYVETGRHIEVQVLADQHGTVWTIGERECSIQRRHQKVIEETPSPLVERLPGLRADLFAAARRAAEAVGYVGAGTVEFLADGNGHFYFLETNTRLQVEHPVTEGVTGLDLVALQLAIAQGDRLPAEPPASSGHAIEARLYAEDPAADWQPQTGTLHRFDVPGGVRVDTGVADSSVVSPHYDPMVAKVIAVGPDRSTAARQLATALAGARIHGLTTNRDLLVRVLRHPAFLAGETDTAFLDRHGLDDLARPLADAEAVRLSAFAAALADAAANRANARVLGGLPIGWRNVPSAPQRKRYEGPDRGQEDLEVAYWGGRGGLVAEGYEGVEVVEASTEHVVLELAGVRRRFDVAAYQRLVCVDSPLGAVVLRAVPRFGDVAGEVAAGSLVAPMPGTVVRVAVTAGDEVTAGQPLLWLEAMKMEHTIAAPVDGVVTELPVRTGQQVEVGAVLAVVKEE